MKRDVYYYSDGSVLHYNDRTKILHRTDGPAIEYANGDKVWYQNGQYHRIDGPAIEHTNGYKEWYLFGKKYDEETYSRFVKNPELIVLL